MSKFIMIYKFISLYNTYEREREREIERERQTDRQTDRQTETETETEIPYFKTVTSCHTRKQSSMFL